MGTTIQTNISFAYSTTGNIRALCLLLSLFNQNRKIIIKAPTGKKSYKKVNKVLMICCKSNSDMKNQEKNDNGMEENKKKLMEN